MRINRILAPNPGPYTGTGTNTWVVESSGECVVIDPGPVDPSHRDEILRALDGLRPVGVLVTHTHIDHAPLANPLADALGVPAYGYAPGPEFDPDLRVSDGDVVLVGEVGLEMVHTPGHADDHLCFLAEPSQQAAAGRRVLFTGDHIMGGSSVMIDDLAAYLSSLRRLQGLALERLYPGHGPELDSPDEVIDWYLAHRLQREDEILTAVRAGATTVAAVVAMVYQEVDRALHDLAARSVTAHLGKLADEGRVLLEGEGAGTRVRPSEGHS